jgi:hypothetical protein
LTLYSTNYTDYWDFKDYSQYVFMDIPAAEESTMGQFYTNRSVTAESSCYSRTQKVVHEPNGTLTIMDGPMRADSTWYWTWSSEDGTASGCGDRCARVYALENNVTHAFSYSCNITVNHVVNTTRWHQQIPDNIARMAGQSIALTGTADNTKKEPFQQQEYDHDFSWGTFLGGRADFMAWRLRTYAIGSIVGADKINPYIQDPVPGFLPTQGVRLKLDHPEFIAAILGGIGGFHFLFFILAAYLANKVVVIDDSYLAIALLLRPVVDKIREHGSLMDSREIVRALGRPDVMYGVVERQGNNLVGRIRHLEISEVSGKAVGGWRGWYD